VLALAACSPGAPARPQSRCEVLQSSYGLTPCPPAPLPVESVQVENGDPAIGEERAQRIGLAYLRSRALYYRALDANSVRFFRSRVIYLPDDSPLLFDSEIRHIGDARARRGRLVVAAHSTLRGVKVLALTPELRGALGGHVTPLAEAVMVTYSGPDEQDIRVAGRPDQPLTTLGPNDTVIQLIAGVLVTAPGLEETWAEVGQWDCHDPDVSRLCGVDAG
jgi:hypothetical protein